MATNGKFVTVVMTDKELGAIDRLQKRRGLSQKRSEIIRVAVMDYCEAEMKKPTPASLQTAIPVEE